MVHEPIHSTQAYISAGIHGPSPSDEDLYDQFVRQHHGATSVEPMHGGFAYGEPSVSPVSNNRKKEIQALREDPFSMDVSRQRQ